MGTGVMLSVVNNAGVTIPAWAAAVVLAAILTAFGVTLRFLVRFALIVVHRFDEHDDAIDDLELAVFGEHRRRAARRAFTNQGSD